MAIYTVLCPDCGEQEVYTHAPVGCEQAPCPICLKVSPRNWDPPQGQPFVSYWTDGLAKGQELPIEIKDRSQERRLCKELGVERIS